MRHYHPGEAVFHAGDSPDFMFFVAAGEINIVTEVALPTTDRPFWIPSFIPLKQAPTVTAKKEVRLSVIGQAGIAGEVNFFVGAPRYYGAISATETLCYIITRFVCFLTRNSVISTYTCAPPQRQVQRNGAAGRAPGAHHPDRGAQVVVALYLEQHRQPGPPLSWLLIAFKT